MVRTVDKTRVMIFATLWLTACGGGETITTDGDDFYVPPLVGQVSEDIFDTDRLIQVTLQMPDADLAQLRGEGRTLASVMSGCPDPDFEFTKFQATVNIDGDQLDNVAIRKKGYLGSISRVRPSIKLNFDTHVEGRTFKGMKRMTLNNDRQDPSHTHQCLAYDLFRAAGLVAPRCNLARVIINGEDLGIYSQIESIKKPFLELNYLDKSGNLYEAQLADLGEHLNDKFELKTNKTANDRSDLAALSAVLDMNDDNLLVNLPLKIDLNEFITFWAVETLLGHWDSATGNANNFYIYHDPTDDLFHFIPWGTDGAFTRENPFKPASGPLYRNLSIASRLFAIDETRDKYFQAINDLLVNHWNEPELLLKLDEVQALTLAPTAAFTHMKTFISGDDSNLSQRALLAAAMAGEIPQTEYLLADVASSCDNATTTALTATFNSSPNDSGSFSFTDASGNRINANMNLVSQSGADSLAYSINESSLPSQVELTLVGYDFLSAQTYVLQVFIESPDYTNGDHNLMGLATNMMLFKLVSQDPLILSLVSVGSTGTISLQQNGDGTSAIQGSIDAQMGLVNVPQ